ncbi:hypothetical protein GALMADRAFT_209945 [Galerina marginata CBS 339.88]|uniref:Uncharacterized protein n=1 Tax=Galerina marginata (strain CBS 339.88) TaxID=685588 RepID=A0A067T5N3_GALM3|nr:hypothetical protein GALMADRAFT_209945 [Galerina marginata CBS 339.88]
MVLGSLPPSQLDMSAATIPHHPELHHDDLDTGHTAFLSSHSSRSGSMSEIPDPDTEEDTTSKLTHRVRKSDIPLLLGILIMLCWPWVLSGVLLIRGGIPLTGRFADLVKKNPKDTTFFATQIGTIVNLIVTFLFSTAILRYSQGWMARKDNISLFHVSLITAFRSHSFPWGPKDGKYLLAQWRWIRVVLVVACIFTFTFIPSAVSTLLNPVPITQFANITGTELDFSPTASDCLEWLNTKTTSLTTNTCQWEKYNGLNYNTCRDGAMSDIIESGRLNVLSSQPDNFEIVSFGGLGASDGLQFIRPLRGVIPIGPDGVQAFDTVTSPQLTSAHANLWDQTNPNAYFLFYDYILHQQGVASNITCSHDSQSPVRVFPSSRGSVGTVQFNGTCAGQANLLPHGTTFTSLNSKNSLTFWACKSSPDPGGVQQSSYSIYLRGLQSYATTVGNMTCTVSMQPSLFPVKFTSDLGVFKTFHHNKTFPTTFPGFIDQAVVALGSLIADAQTQQTNLVAETVTALGVKYFSLQADKQVQQPAYLPIYEAMIQGILEYEVSYTRLLYSTFTDRPASCNRTMNGVTVYSVLGWSVLNESFGFLIPMTLINLTSLVLLLVAMFRTKRGSYKYDPTDPEVLALAKAERHVVGKHHKMGSRVVFYEKVTPAAE